MIPFCERNSSTAQNTFCLFLISGVIWMENNFFFKLWMFYQMIYTVLAFYFEAGFDSFPGYKQHCQHPRTSFTPWKAGSSLLFPLQKCRSSNNSLFSFHFLMCLAVAVQQCCFELSPLPLHSQHCSSSCLRLRCLSIIRVAIHPTCEHGNETESWCAEYILAGWTVWRLRSDYLYLCERILAAPPARQELIQ